MSNQILNQTLNRQHYQCMLKYVSTDINAIIFNINIMLETHHKFKFYHLFLF